MERFIVNPIEYEEQVIPYKGKSGLKYFADAIGVPVEMVEFDLRGQFKLKAVEPASHSIDVRKRNE